MRKLPLEEFYHPDVDALLNDPELTRQEIDEHLHEMHPHPLRPITDETVNATVDSKHTFYNFYYYGLHAAKGLPEAMQQTLREAALLHVCGGDQPDVQRKKAKQFATLLQHEAECFEKLSEKEHPSDGLQLRSQNG